MPDGSDAGVGHDDVESAELFDAVVEHRFHVVVVANVDDRGDDALAELLDQRGGLFEVLRCRTGCRRVLELLADVDGDDVGALLGQAHRMAATLSTRRARDERDLSCYSPCCLCCHLNLASNPKFEHLLQ